MASQAAPVVVQRQQSSARRHHSRQSSSSSRPPTVTIRQAGDNGSSNAPSSAREQDRLAPQPSSHRTQHSRDYADQGANGGHHREESSSHHAQKQQRKTSIKGESGTWILGKTIGAGSMGKVKLARKADGTEQVAVKIVPRQTPADRDRIDPATGQPYPPRHDESKEIRTAREAAIVTLLDHPYICAMRDVIQSQHHWYMLCEYVNGGQMLDYIISHGRLKEKQARKFARQIASALDYCHRNSIVHRDLKIENILISKTGDIKIIDFGLSNLFSPYGHLKTFCGSLYFAAPELLQAKQYVGPEVDVWSFGIVLYVLVCGKVPFDDQSMPALHAKIKKGQVDYPQWLTADCKHLLSRMLVTDPKLRATLSEVINHPWMNKGYSGPPENKLPQREPLTLPLDPEVIKGMTGFEFGTAEAIQNRLTRIIESDEYQRAVRNASRDMPTPTATEKKKGFGFDFYKRRSSTASKDTLVNSSAEALSSSSQHPDPFNAFNPLISIYYLVRERQERERREAGLGHSAPLPTPDVDKLMRIPVPKAPEAAHAGDTHYEIRGEPTPTNVRNRPRARTHGEDEVVDAVKKANVGASLPATPAIGVVSPPAPEPVKKESTTASILRRFSTRRHHHRDTKPLTPTLSVHGSRTPPTADAQSPRKSLSTPRTAGPQEKNYLTPPTTADGITSSSWSSKLGRSTSVSGTEWRRGGNNEKGEPSPLNPRTHTSRTKSVQHARRESTQTVRPRSRIEETDFSRDRSYDRASRHSQLSEKSAGQAGASSPGEAPASDFVKPVYLKGLFSVATTSTKPPAVIRADLIRVLTQLGVAFREIKSGFACSHSPSIDLKSVVDAAPPAPETAANLTPAHRRRLSFVGGSKHKDPPPPPADPLPPTTPSRRRQRADTVYTNSDESSESVPGGASSGGNGGSGSGAGDSLVVQFEIYIVKVPLLSLHGIQFKSVSKGNVWVYKSLASKILQELRL